MIFVHLFLEPVRPILFGNGVAGVHGLEGPGTCNRLDILPRVVADAVKARQLSDPGVDLLDGLIIGMFPLEGPLDRQFVQALPSSAPLLERGEEHGSIGDPELHTRRPGVINGPHGSPLTYASLDDAVVTHDDLLPVDNRIYTGELEPHFDGAPAYLGFLKGTDSLCLFNKTMSNGHPQPLGDPVGNSAT